MKNLIPVLLLLILGYNASAQIKQIKTEESVEIGKYAPMGMKSIVCQKTGDTFTFLYKDLTYQHISEWKSFSFLDIDNAFENLYQIVMDGLENIPEEDVLIELPDDMVYFHFVKSMGIPSVQFRHAVGKSDVIGTSSYLTKKQVQKLFGKR